MMKMHTFSPKPLFSINYIDDHDWDSLQITLSSTAAICSTTLTSICHNLRLHTYTIVTNKLVNIEHTIIDENILAQQKSLVN